MVLSYFDLNDDVLEYINELREKKENIVFIYVRYLYIKLMFKNIEFIYYYLKFNNKNIKPYLMDKTKLMKIYNRKFRFNLFDIYYPNKDKPFNFTDIIDDICKMYNEIILNVYDYINKSDIELLDNYEKILINIYNDYILFNIDI